MFRRTCLALAALALLLPTAAGAAKPDCRRSHSETIYQSPRVRLFEVHKDLWDSRFACLRRTNNRVKVGRVYEDMASDLSDFLERGLWLGFLDTWSAKNGGYGMNPRAVNLRTGKTNVGGDFFTTVHGYGLTHHGSLAWIESENRDDVAPPPNPVYSVYEKEQDAEAKLLDSGEDVDPHSLAVAGHRVYWARGGQVKTAPIP